MVEFFPEVQAGNFSFYHAEQTKAVLQLHKTFFENFTSR